MFLNLKGSQTYSLYVGEIITIYAIQESLLRMYKIVILILNQILAFWMKEKRNQCIN